MEERDYYLGFSQAPGIGPKKLELLLKNFGSLKKAWNADYAKLSNILKPVLTQKFNEFRKQFNFEEYQLKLQKQKIKFICLQDLEYPPLLKQIPYPPIGLYAKGNMNIFRGAKVDAKIFSLSAQGSKKLNLKTEGSNESSENFVSPRANTIAIVGTRKITSYGREITEMFAGDLARAGLVIVSGMAYGVDGVAHQSVINASGKTIAVLGNGVDMAYPRENQKLYEEILDSGGAVVSEYKPGEPPSMGSFPARNRIVAGMSEGILVTEGASDSGSLITANFGLEFGRKVFAVPGPITSQLSKAPLELIEKGAKLVTSAQDILNELRIKNHELRTKTQDAKFQNLSKDELKIVRLLENERLSFDEIVRRSKLDSSVVASLISMLEIKGIIKSSDGLFQLPT
jgi:DNA processing protein